MLTQETTQQIDFTRNLEANATMFFIIEEVKNVLWIFHKELIQFSKFILL